MKNTNLQDTKKQTIYEAADKYTRGSLLDAEFNNTKYNSFITGALSPEAREYWQQDLFTEYDVRCIIDEVCGRAGFDDLIDKWFEKYNNRKQ